MVCCGLVSLQSADEKVEEAGSWHLNNTINVSDTLLTALQLLTHWILRQAYEVGAIIIAIL